MKYILIEEHSIKSSLAYHYLAIYGVDQNEYLSFYHYEVTNSKQQKIDKLISIFQYQLEDNNNYAFINHYKSKHRNVPLWIMIHVLTLGQVSHMFDLLKATVPI